jgi:hypothetical protein
LRAGATAKCRQRASDGVGLIYCTFVTSFPDRPQTGVRRYAVAIFLSISMLYHIEPIDAKS